MKRFSEFLRIIVFFWRSRLSIDAKKRKRRRENRVRAYAMAREERRTPRSLRRVCYFRFVGSGGGGVGYPLHLDHSIAFYAGGFMSNYLSHFEVMRVFIEHNEHFEIQGVDQ